ncbi:MAG: hypothetical protein SGI77_01725 [Pirellulaceae bacterium]|nr:hypothetical protein [Pirellulaceae bacterium]
MLYGNSITSAIRFERARRSRRMDLAAHPIGNELEYPTPAFETKCNPPAIPEPISVQSGSATGKLIELARQQRLVVSDVLRSSTIAASAMTIAVGCNFIRWECALSYVLGSWIAHAIATYSMFHRFRMNLNPKGSLRSHD